MALAGLIDWFLGFWVLRDQNTGKNPEKPETFSGNFLMKRLSMHSSMLSPQPLSSPCLITASLFDLSLTLAISPRVQSSSSQMR
jgi:hypothetical protein